MAEQPKNDSTDGTEFVMFVFIAVMVAGVLYACYWLCQIPISINGAITEFDQRLERVSRIGLLTVGIVGFPLAMWRSYLSYKQTNEAIAQGNRVERQMKFTERQINAAEENNLATILEKATGLLSNDKPPAVRAAGLALLNYSASGIEKTFALEATNLLSDFVKDAEIIYGPDKDPLVITALGYIESIGRKRDEPLRAEVLIAGDDTARFLKYCEFVQYRECNFILEDFYNGGSNYFSHCSFWECRTDRRMIIRESAEFKDCDILGFHGTKGAVVSFNNCDFSHGKVVPRTSECTLVDCYYDIGAPPSQGILDRFGEDLAKLSKAEVDARKRGNIGSGFKSI